MVSDTTVLTCIIEFNAYHDESIGTFYWWWVRSVWGGPGGGNPFKFSVSL